MAPRKLTRRARFNGLPPHRNPGAEPLFADDDARGPDDADDWDRLDDLDDLERLLDDLESSRRSNRGRAVRVAPAAAGPGPLARAWLTRVESCGASEAARAHGEDAIARGAISGLFVQRGRITAEVAGARRYRIAVDFLPPSFALTAAVMARVNEVRATLPAGERQREAVQEAILAAGPSIFPSPAQMASSCTCNDGQQCAHVVAAVHGLGVALDREPELLFTLWGLSEPGPRRLQAIIVAPLPPDRPMLGGDLGALFGIDLLDEEITTRADATSPAGSSTAATQPTPPSNPPSAPAAEATTRSARGSRAAKVRGEGSSRASANAPAIEPSPPPVQEAAPTPPSIEAPAGGKSRAARRSTAAIEAAVEETPATTTVQANLPLVSAEVARAPARGKRSRRSTAEQDEAASLEVAAPPPSPPRRIPPCERPEAEREYLRVLGLSNRTINAWVREGVLGSTDRRDVFRRTPEANRRIAEFLAQ